MDNGEIIETSPDGKYRVRLVRDDDPSNPRTEYDQLTNVITPHGQRYIDIDADGGPLQDAWDHFYRQQDYDDDKAVKLLTRYARYHGVTVVDDRPHDGAWGLWYVMPDKAAEAPDATPEKIIESAIAEYRAWAEGDVYGYVIEKRIAWQVKEGSEPAEGEEYVTEMETWEDIDSCWGHIGYEYAGQAAKEAFAEYLPVEAAEIPARIRSVADGRTAVVSDIDASRRTFRADWSDGTHSTESFDDGGQGWEPLTDETSE